MGDLSIDFIAIDVETANADLSSICQIGLAFYKDNVLVKTWSSLINPETDFDPINISIHGINPLDITNSPKLNEKYNELKSMIENVTLVSHMSFDRVAMYRAFEKYNLKDLNNSWIDSAKVVRRTWTELSKKGYGLANVANMLNIKFNHHDALEDAIACGEILIRALDKSSMTLSEMQTRTQQSIDGGHSSRISINGNVDGSLHGEVLVFTGALLLPRREAAKFAADAGCDVSASVKKSVTILVVGDQDTTKLAGHEKSSKHRKAEELIEKGQNIKIIGESDFKILVGI